MKLITWIRLYIIFFIGLLFNSFGVAFVTKATLGTSSPIAAIPYSLSLIISQLSFGTWTIIFSILLVILQFPILKFKVDYFEISLQIIISFLFGYFINLSMLFLKALEPQSYLFKLLFLIIGCVIIAIGAYLEVIADVAMLPGDAFIRAISKRLSRSYSSLRVISDISMSVIGAIICLAFLHNMQGVREGTIIAALLVGNLVKIILILCHPFTTLILPNEKLTGGF